MDKRLFFALLCGLLALSPRPGEAVGGRVLRLSGDREWMEVADAPDLHLGSELSVTGWFRADRLEFWEFGSWQALFWKGNEPDPPYENREYGLWLNREGRLHITTTPKGRGALMPSTSEGLVQVGKWRHFALVISGPGNYVRLYLDGQQVIEVPFEGSGTYDTSGPLRLGSIPDRDYFQGAIEEVAIWSRALGVEEIQQGREHSPQGNEEGLVAWYTFDELDAAGMVPDLTGKGHVGVLQGGAHLADWPGNVLLAAVAPDSALVDSAASPVVAGDQLRGSEASALIFAFRSTDYAVRRTAVEGLQRVAPEDFDRVAVEALVNDDFAVRRRAIQIARQRREAGSLGAMSEDGFSRVITTALQSNDFAVRREAAAILARSSGPLAAVPPGPAAPPSRDPWAPERYRDWDRYWYAPRPADWEMQPEGMVLRYNRVEGVYGGWRLPRNYHPGQGLTNYGAVGYSLNARELSYQAGAEVFSFYSPPQSRDNLVAMGAEVHDLTDTQDGWLLSEEENSVDALLFHRDFRDYYRRAGWSLYSSHNLGGVLQLTGRYARDEFGSLENEVEWGLFESRFAREAFRPNPPVDEVEVASIRADLQFDTRNRIDEPHRGWFANALFERAGGFLGGEARFKRYLGDVRRYQPVGHSSRVDLRLRLGTAKGGLPTQYLYDLGGFASLRGYGFKQFSGDRMGLFSAEYWVNGEAQWPGDLPVDDLSVGLFFDAGSAWFAGDQGDPFDTGDLEVKKSLGFALQCESARLYLARPLDGAERDWALALRFSRTF
ncbi:MAG: BamA/TamA family outer membrane protein [Candidatus Latescibacteria bacterium]|nr:BamA/TamA family outer membrane protein [Candidatus Latescibacterota bacterium]